MQRRGRACFLFDEPLSNLDAKLRADLRVEIKRLHQQLENTMIYVTHDQIEAMTLADRIAIMKDGLIQQLASPNEIYNRPANKYVADFIGSPSMNFFEGVVETGGAPVMRTQGINIPLAGYPFANGPIDGDVWFGIRPEHILTGDQAASAPVRHAVSVDLVELLGSDTLVWATFNDMRVHIRLGGQANVSAGKSLDIGFDPALAPIFDKSNELRL